MHEETTPFSKNVASASISIGFTKVDKAVEMAEDKVAFWQLRQQSLIYAKAGDKKGAIAAAKKSLAASEKAGNMDYVKMNKDTLKWWGVM